MPDSYEIGDYAFIGRTLAEYRRMFDLDPDSLAGGRVLDCPSGACSFVAEASEWSVDAVGADVLYDRTPAELASRAAADAERASAALDDVEDLYEWDYYGDVAGLRAHREHAASRFLADYARRGERYVRAELPTLPFSDGAFDLVVSAHFCFLYDDRLDADFHVAALRELLRVGDALRVFPLAGFDAERSAHVEPVLDALREDGRDVRIESVPFEFQSGADAMLVAER